MIGGFGTAPFAGLGFARYEERAAKPAIPSSVPEHLGTAGNRWAEPGARWVRPVLVGTTRAVLWWLRIVLAVVALVMLVNLGAAVAAKQALSRVR